MARALTPSRASRSICRSWRMVSSLLAGIPSSSWLSRMGMPRLLTRGERRRRNRLQSGRLHLGTLAGIKSERWPTSARNRWPACFGICRSAEPTAGQVVQHGPPAAPHSPPMFLMASTTFSPSSTPKAISSEYAMALRSSRTLTTVPSKISRQCRRRRDHAPARPARPSGSFSQARLPRPLPTWSTNNLANARRARRVFMPACRPRRSRPRRDRRAACKRAASLFHSCSPASSRRPGALGSTRRAARPRAGCPSHCAHSPPSPAARCSPALSSCSAVFAVQRPGRTPAARPSQRKPRGPAAAVSTALAEQVRGAFYACCAASMRPSMS